MDRTNDPRTRGIGGTDIAAIVGLHPWKTPFDVYLEKVGMGEPAPVKLSMRLGLLLEPVIFELYREVEGHGPTDFYQPTLMQHRTRPWQIGTPDRLHRSGASLLELKTAGSRQERYWGPSGTQEIPEHYLLQVMWYLSLVDAEYGDIAVLIAGQDFRVYRFHRDHALDAMLLQEAEAFWHTYVLPQHPPPLDGSRKTEAYLARRYPHHTEEMVPADEAVRAHVARYLACEREAERATTELLREKNRLKQVIGDKAGIDLGDGDAITWKQSKPSYQTDWKGLALSYQPTLEEISTFTEEVPGVRRFVKRISA